MGESIAPKMSPNELSTGEKFFFPNQTIRSSIGIITAKKGAKMATREAIRQTENNPERIFAEISTAYIEILAGMRSPDQLARWLSDKTYYDLCQKCRRENRSRQVTGAKSRPAITIRRSRVFLTDVQALQGVVVVDISGATKAVSIRAEVIHDRYRVTDLVLL